MPQLTENFFRQGLEESLDNIPRPGDGPRRVRFIHVLNPYRPRNAEGTALQERTFQTIRMAMRVAAPEVDVLCVCVAMPDEQDVIPPDFIAAEPFERTVLDLARFRKPFPLPLVFDILDKALAMPLEPAPDCEDYVIFTNTDIHLAPHFYLTILEFVRAGYDAIDVNRRNLPASTPANTPLALMYAGFGVRHGGTDCSVFPRRLYASFAKNHACIGRSWVMRGVIYNCAVMARRYLVLRAAHLTFHIGNDRPWANPDFADYTAFNAAESNKVIAALSQDPKSAQRLIAYLESHGPWRANRMQRERVWAAQDAARLPRTSPPWSLFLRLKLQGVRRRLGRLLLPLIPPEA